MRNESASGYPEQHQLKCKQGLNAIDAENTIGISITGTRQKTIDGFAEIAVIWSLKSMKGKTDASLP